MCVCVIDILTFSVIHPCKCFSFSFDNIYLPCFFPSLLTPFIFITLIVRTFVYFFVISFYLWLSLLFLFTSFLPLSGPFLHLLQFTLSLSSTIFSFFFIFNFSLILISSIIAHFPSLFSLFLILLMNLSFPCHHFHFSTNLNSFFSLSIFTNHFLSLNTISLFS